MASGWVNVLVVNGQTFSSHAALAAKLKPV
jgi:hypothetical protein